MAPPPGPSDDDLAARLWTATFLAFGPLAAGAAVGAAVGFTVGAAIVPSDRTCAETGEWMCGLGEALVAAGIGAVVGVGVLIAAAVAISRRWVAPGRRVATVLAQVLAVPALLAAGAYGADALGSAPATPIAAAGVVGAIAVVRLAAGPGRDRPQRPAAS